MSKAIEYIESMMAQGRYSFSASEARTALSGSAEAVKLALRRLTKKGVLASPSRGFYVIVSPEYRRLGCPPAEQFIPALMEQQKKVYYVALLSAAQYYGAAHHRPQIFQVALAKNRSLLKCGAVKVSFIARKNISHLRVQYFNTPRGQIRVSAPEVTAYDLVGYMEQAGGIDNVATVLADLKDHIDPAQLIESALSAPLVWSQRLGYLLEYVGAEKKLKMLKEYVMEEARDFTPLVPHEGNSEKRKDKNWKLLINVDIEADT